MKKDELGKDKTKETVKIIIGREISKARKKRGMNREDLLGKLCKEYEIDLSDYTLQAYELGNRSISPINLFTISKIIELDLEVLKETVTEKVKVKKN